MGHACEEAHVPVGNKKNAEVRGRRVTQLVLVDAVKRMHDEGGADGELLHQSHQGADRHTRAWLGHAPHLFWRHMEGVIGDARLDLAERGHDDAHRTREPVGQRTGTVVGKKLHTRRKHLCNHGGRGAHMHLD